MNTVLLDVFWSIVTACLMLRFYAVNTRGDRRGASAVATTSRGDRLINSLLYRPSHRRHVVLTFSMMYT